MRTICVFFKKVHIGLILIFLNFATITVPAQNFYTVEGTVQNADKEPVGWVDILLVTPDDTIVSTRTEPDGSFFFEYQYILTSTGRVPSLPDDFRLSGNYPNPFNPSTSLKLATPENGDYQIRVYDILGRMLADKSATLKKGHHRINISDFAGNGVYLVRVSGNGLSSTQKITKMGYRGTGQVTISLGNDSGNPSFRNDEWRTARSLGMDGLFLHKKETRNYESKTIQIPYAQNIWRDIIVTDKISNTVFTGNVTSNQGAPLRSEYHLIYHGDTLQTGFISGAFETTYSGPKRNVPFTFTAVFSKNRRDFFQENFLSNNAYDLGTMQLSPVKSGKVTLKYTYDEEAIAGVYVRIMDAETDWLIAEAYTDKQGKVQFDLELYSDVGMYKIKSSRDHYFEQ